MVRAALIAARGRANRARGAALVTAMLIAALAAAVVAALASSQSQWLASVELRRDRAQAQAIVLAAMAWTRSVLQEDARAGNLDHLGESWALPLPPTPLEGGFVEGTIVDAQGRLDVNRTHGDSAIARATRERFGRLLLAAGIDAAVLDQLGAGEPSVRAAEVAALPVLGERGFARVAAFVTALPAERPLNVNTAPAEVLAAIVPELSAEALAELVADRLRKPYATLAEFRQRLPASASLASEAGLGVRSDFFLVTVRARQGDAQARGRALLRRRGRDAPDVVWQTIE